MSQPRVELVCPPFRGHLHPMLAMARALEPVADVRVLSTSAASAEIAASGIRGEVLLADEDALIESIANPAHPIRNNPVAMVRQLRQTLGLLERLRAIMKARYARDRPSLVIVDSVLPTVGLAAVECGVRWWTSIASPCAIEPHRGAPGYLGGWDHREDWLGRLRDRVGLGLTRGFKRLVHRLHRRQLRALGLPAIYRRNGDEAIYSPECILGLGLPELEFPRQWPKAFCFVGPQLYTPPTDFPPIALESGRRHVLVTFGTHLRWIKDSHAEAVARFATHFPDLVFHFSDGRPENSSGFGSSASFRRHTYVPYDRGLEKFDLVVHHGGAGITYHCIRTARPSVVLPVDYDQFDYAARISRAGIGLRIGSLRELPSAVRSALDDPRLRQACGQFQRHLLDFDPPARLRKRVYAALYPLPSASHLA